MKSIIYLIFLLQSVNSIAQSPNLQWSKVYGGAGVNESFNCIKTTSDGGYIACGHTTSTDNQVTGNHGAVDMWLVKLNSTGDLIWQKCFGGTNGDYATSVIQTSDGGYLMVGHALSIDFDAISNHSNGIDLLVVKTNSSGIKEWSKCYGGTADEGNGDFFDVIQTSDGNFIIGAETLSNDGDVSGNNGARDLWVLKINSIGNLIWQKTIGSNLNDFFGGLMFTSANEILVSSLSIGDFTGDFVNFTSPGKATVTKLDENGNIIWVKNYGGSMSEGFFDLKEDQAGNYILAGYSYSTDYDVSNNYGSSDAWVVKTSNTGSIIWEKNIGGSDEDVSTEILIDGNDVFLSGYTMSNDSDVFNNHSPGIEDGWIFQLNNLGNLIWQKCLGGSSWDCLYSLDKKIGGGIIACGVTNSSDGDIQNDFYDEDLWVVSLEAFVGIDELIEHSSSEQ